MTQNLDQSWIDAVTQGSDLPGPDGLRADAAASVTKTGLPHRRMEDWKYTDLRTRLAAALPLATPLEAPGDFAEPFAALNAHEVCFGNGFWAAEMGEAPEGVELISLADAIETNKECALSYLGKASAPEGHPMVALNTALMTDGACLRVTKDTKAGTILFSNEGQAGRQMVRNLIVVEEGAEVTLIEMHQGSDEAQQVQQVTEIFVEANAKLTHIRMQNAGAKTAHLATDLIDVARNANYRGFVLTTGAELARQESYIEFSGENAEAHISGAYLLSGKQHADVTSRIHHAVPHCISREVFKGVITDEARGVFQGRIVVARDAQKTDGHQLNKTLLLSPKAEIDAKPELEIYADDVKCSHGATSGQLDEGQLFYLRARGIPEDEARGLLIESFMSEALLEVENEIIRDILAAHVATWLATHAGLTALLSEDAA